MKEQLPPDDAAALQPVRTLGGVVGGRAPAPSPGEAAMLLLVGLRQPTLEALWPLLPSQARVVTVDSAEDGFAQVAAHPTAVICLGEDLAGEHARRFLDAVIEDKRAGHQALQVRSRHHVVLAGGTDLSCFQDLVDAEALYYLAPRPPAPRDIAAILGSALANRPYASQTHDPSSGPIHGPTHGPDHASEIGEAGNESAQALDAMVDLADRLSTVTDLSLACAHITHMAATLIAADDADCRIHDVAGQILWRPASPQHRGVPSSFEESGDDLDSTTTGLLGFTARTGQAVRIDRADVDPRFDPDSDLPGVQQATVRVLTAPIGLGDSVLAVLAAWRDEFRPAFDRKAMNRLALLGQHVAPALGRLLRARGRAQRRTVERASTAATRSTAFRPEAIAHHAAGQGERGRPLEISPGWTRWVFRLLISVLAVAAAFVGLGSIHEYALGPAVVRLGDRLDVPAKRGGIITAVEVEAGERVAAGDLLARFDSESEVAELARIHAELELGLVQHLLNPDDPSMGRTLGALRAQEAFAHAQLEARAVRAPVDGVVSVARIRAGQHLTPGQVVATLADDTEESAVVALLPGHFRPFLRPGMALRLTFDGDRFAPQELTIDRIGSEVIGPAEARRFVGAEIADSLALQGALVWVRARLPANQFESGGHNYPITDGIQATAEVRVRSERIFTTLFPGWKGLGRGR